ncbi:MAG: DNA-directed RNA polymerase subunit alpha [Candidatus Pacebacteria bacterium]|nr:DNA-directed RNA polymerase subunit alpha [Candidatus Paceibacterota bacterium]
MDNVALPNKIEFSQGDEPNSGIVTIEPLYIGYGMTLGNSLRRVLLSSLEGAAVTGVKIKGANHEFMALDHIKEDVLELLLNLKELRLKVFTDEEVKLELHVTGKKKVTAKDIEANSDVEIINNDLEIATITDDKGSLDMEIFVAKGLGYKMSDSDKKENKDIGYLEIDSVFSPITAVSLKVENARVGKMTNWDKLILNIATDGTISPKDAFNKAVQILVEQFSVLTFAEGTKEKKVAKDKKDEKDEDKKDSKKETKDKKEK